MLHVRECGGTLHILAVVDVHGTAAGEGQIPAVGVPGAQRFRRRFADEKAVVGMLRYHRFAVGQGDEDQRQHCNDSNNVTTSQQQREREGERHLPGYDVTHLQQRTASWRRVTLLVGRTFQMQSRLFLL